MRYSSFNDMKLKNYARAVWRLFVLTVLIRQITVLPLSMARFTDGFLGFKSLKYVGDEFVSFVMPIIIAIMTRFAEDKEDPKLSGRLHSQGIPGELK